MAITLNGTAGITNDGAYTGDGVLFADGTPANTLVTTTGGRVGIGESLPGQKLDVDGNIGITGEFYRYETASSGYILYQKGGVNNNGLYWEPINTQFSIWTNSVRRTSWNNNGFYINTLPSTAAGTNMHIWTGSSPVPGLVFISTSSIRYKTDIEDVWDSKVDNILKFRPIWYRSTTEHDNKEWSWYGFIAEEVAEIEPRLVNYGYAEEDYEIDEKGDKVLKEGAQQTPNGVQYDRMVVLLTAMVQKQDKMLKEQQTIIEDLKSRITALESASA